MTIGKREQIVVGIIVAIITVAILHMTIFAQRQAALRTAQGNFAQTAGKVQQMKQAPSTKVLVEYTSLTQTLLTQLEEGVNQLGMEKLDEFVTPDPKDPNFLTILLQKLNQQLDMIMRATARLAEFSASQKTRMSFLDQRQWGIPTALPPRMQSSALWDTLNEIKDTRGVLNSSTPGSEVYLRTQQRYNQLLQQVGLDIGKVEQLKEYGEFVPIYYQMQILNLILSRIPEGETILIRQEVLTRDNLMTILGIKRPTDTIPNLTETLSYFVYQYLNFVNQLLAMAETHGIQEVTNVTLRGWSFLRKAPDEKQLPNMTVDAPASLEDDRQMPFDYVSMGGGIRLPKAVRQRFNGLALLTSKQLADLQARGYPREQIAKWTALDFEDHNVKLRRPSDSDHESGGGIGIGIGIGASAAPTPAPQALESKPRDEDIGYAFPVEITFRAPNKEGWTFIYDVLNKTPLNELYRISMTSMSTQRPADTNIEFTVTFLFVSKLFKTIDTVRDLLKQLGPNPTAPKPAPAAEKAATPTG
jgi:hypothetical protein